MIGQTEPLGPTEHLLYIRQSTIPKLGDVTDLPNIQKPKYRDREKYAKGNCRKFFRWGKKKKKP